MAATGALALALAGRAGHMRRVSFSERLKNLTDPPSRVAHVRLDGIIAGRGGFGRGGLNIDALEPVLTRAFGLKRLKAVALSINSPGGSPAQSSLIGARIRALAEEKKVPVLGFVEDVAASGGYWLACAADEIFVDRSSIVGSIGVISSGFGFQHVLARAGVERRLHTAGSRKSKLDPFGPEKPEDVAWLRSLQDEIHTVFKQWVQARRGDKLASTEPNLFEGEVFLGERAVALGLADALGTLPQLVRERFGERARIIQFGQRRRGFLSRLLPIEQAGASLMHLAEERAAFARFGL
jgi:serine protease SohB